MDVPPTQIVDNEAMAWSVFLCISRHQRAENRFEDTDVYIGPTNSLPTHNKQPYCVGMIVDGFLSFGEAKIICDWARGGRHGARQLAHALLAVCHQVKVYRPTVDVNVLLGLQNVPYRVFMDKDIIHCTPSTCT